MTTAQMDMLVFKDQAGEYFVLPQVALERGRVSGEMRAAIEERFPALQALGTAGDDTQGHALFVVGAVIGAGVTVIAFGTTLSLIRGGDLGPLIRAVASQYE